MSKKCLVTGGAGFIGSNLVDALIERGDEVIIIDNLSNGKKENINPQAKFVLADIRNLEEIAPHFTGVDYVFHVAAMARVQPSIVDPKTFNDVNVDGTLNVLLAAKDAGVERVVYSASSSAYGNQIKMPLTEDMLAHPINPYGLQKYIGELYMRLFYEVYNLPTVCLRYFNVYGKRQNFEGAYAPVMGIFARQRLAGEPLTVIGDGNQARDYTNVMDVVQANILAAESENVGKGETINAGRGHSYTLNEVAAMMGGPTINLPARFEIKISQSDSSLAKKLLGWEPKVDLPIWLEQYKKELGI